MRQIGPKVEIRHGKRSSPLKRERESMERMRKRERKHGTKA